MRDIKINFSDPRDEGLKKLSNLLDPLLLEEFRRRLYDPDENRTLNQLVEALLEGR